jgi:hypothetical protein
VKRLLAVAVCALALAPVAAAATTVTAPEFDGQGRLVATPFAPPVAAAHLTKRRALDAVLRYPKVTDWLARYPLTDRVDEETFDGKTASWTVKLWQGKAGEIVEAKVDDASGAVTEAWTGPQVAWKMGRGSPGAFGGTKINSPWLWGILCLVFFVGLADFRKLVSLRNVDLLMLLSPTASLWFFNHGNVFTAVPLFYPALVWVVARGIAIGITGRGSTSRPVWPTWVLIAATVFLAGFRIGLNVQASNVIDVGYSGVIGAERIVHGQAPWGNFPIEGDLKACGEADAAGEIRERIQANGRCESANPQGDTYGPVAYESYIPGYGLFGWSGKWDSLPAAHFTAIAFDLLCILGLWLVGRRFGGLQLAAVLAFAWTAYPFTQYASSSNTNDAVMPAFLIWGFWLVSSPVSRGAATALASWTKFASLVVVPLWLTYPSGLRRTPSLRFVAAFLAATVLAFSILLLEPSLRDAFRAFWDRTVAFQYDRDSPFSIWDWGQYHARGIPDLASAQTVVQVCTIVLAGVAAVLPRRKGPLELAALTASLLLAFELSLTHWFYLYLPWVLPFVLLALFLPREGRPREAPTTG